MTKPTGDKAVVPNEELKVGRAVRLYYGSGSLAYGVKDAGFAYFLLFFYQQVLGLPGIYAGIAILIAMLLDALSDPLVGVWSDNTRSRWGRRHPFMYAAAIPVAFVYFWLWNPPAGLDHFQLFLYLTGVTVLVRFFVTLYEVPSSAMVAELTDNYEERTKLLGYRYMMGWYGGLTMNLIMWGALFVIYGSTSTAFKIYGAIGASIMFLAILLSSLGLHKYIPYLRAPPERSSYKPRTLLRDLGVTLKNRNFAAIFLAGVFASGALGVQAALDTYIVTHFWGFTPNQWRFVIATFYVSAILPVFIAPFLTATWGKKTGLMFVYAFQILFAATPVILRLWGWFPENGHPALYPLIWAHSVINVTMIIICGVLLSSMLADIVEHSESSTSRREEGLFFAARSFAQKAASGIGILFAGIALDVIQFSPKADPGTVAEGTLWNLGFIYGPLTMLLYFMALASIGFYRINRRDHEERTAALKARRLHSQNP